jgi:hypothetical protein
MVAMYRQAKSREQYSKDITVSVNENSMIKEHQIQINFTNGAEVTFAYCPNQDRIFLKSSLDLTVIGHNDTGVIGRPNMFGESGNEKNEHFDKWIADGWKCFRYGECFF